MTLRALACSIVLASTVAAFAQPSRDQERERLDAIVKPLIEQGRLRSAVVGLIDRSGSRVYGFGRLSASPDAAAPDGDTVYEIASVTKTFTATLLAEMAERKEAALGDPVSKHLPATLKLPKTDQPITLLLLATHHSGLPRMPSNFRPKDGRNPYADYTVENLYAFLPGAAVHPEATFEYSNLAYGLLGHALERRAGKSYDELIAGRIAAPLGMTDTRQSLSPSMRQRLAPPFDADLDAARNWDFLGIPAGGALRSTTNDMLKYVAAQLDLGGATTVPDPLRRAIAATHEPRGDAGNPDMRIGLGWHLTKAGVHWHNGQTGGYHSFVAFDKRAGAGVVVLTNTAAMFVDAVGQRALGILKGQDPKPLRLPVATKLPALELDKYVARYTQPGGVPGRTQRDGDRLIYSALGTRAVRLYPISETEFFAKSDDHRVTFELDTGGKPIAVIVKHKGKETRAQRTPE